MAGRLVGVRSRPSLVGVDMSILAELGSLAPHRDWEVEVLCVLVIPSDRQGSRGPRKDPGDAERPGGWDDIHIPKGQREGLITASFLEKLL